MWYGAIFYLFGNTKMQHHAGGFLIMRYAKTSTAKIIIIDFQSIKKQAAYVSFFYCFFVIRKFEKKPDIFLHNYM